MVKGKQKDVQILEITIRTKPMFNRRDKNVKRQWK